MFASIPAIISVGLTVIQGAQALIKLGKDAGPAVALLAKLFGGGKVTEAELADIRAKADALNSEIESQTEAGQ